MDALPSANSYKTVCAASVADFLVNPLLVNWPLSASRMEVIGPTASMQHESYCRENCLIVM